MDTLGLHHVAVCVDDLAAAQHFYVDQLGFAVLPTRPDFGFPGLWLQAGAHQIHLMELAEVAPDGRNHLALMVPDLEGALAELDTAGVTYRRSTYFPGAGRQAFLKDPSGNSIELNQPDQPAR